MAYRRLLARGSSAAIICYAVCLTDNRLKRTCESVGKGPIMREIAAWLVVGKTALHEALRTELF